MRFAQKWTTCTVQGIRDVAPAIREFVLRPEGTNVENYAVGSHVNIGVLIDGRPLVGHAGGEAVLLVRAGQEIFATGATCTSTPFAAARLELRHAT